MKWYQFWKKPWWPWKKQPAAEIEKKVLNALLEMKSSEDYGAIKKSITSLATGKQRSWYIRELPGSVSYINFIISFIAALSTLSYCLNVYPEGSGFINAFMTVMQTAGAFIASAGILEGVARLFCIRRKPVIKEQPVSVKSHIIQFITHHEILETGPDSEIGRNIIETEDHINKLTTNIARLRKFPLDTTAEVANITSILKRYKTQRDLYRAQRDKLAMFFNACYAICNPIDSFDELIEIENQTRASAARLEILELEGPTVAYQAIQRFVSSMSRLNAAVARITDLAIPAKAGQHDTIITQIEILQASLGTIPVIPPALPDPTTIPEEHSSNLVLA